jgi:hypothetical protein
MAAVLGPPRAGRPEPRAASGRNQGSGGFKWPNGRKRHHVQWLALLFAV